MHRRPGDREPWRFEADSIFGKAVAAFPNLMDEPDQGMRRRQDPTQILAPKIAHARLEELLRGRVRVAAAVRLVPKQDGIRQRVQNGAVVDATRLDRKSVGSGTGG